MQTPKITIAYPALGEALKAWGANHLVFSMTETKENGEGDAWIVEIPDIFQTSPAIQGKVKILIDYWRVAETPVYSETLTDPTWKDLILATDKLLAQGDGCGIFLEGFSETKQGDTLILTAEIGS